VLCGPEGDVCERHGRDDVLRPERLLRNSDAADRGAARPEPVLYLRRWPLGLRRQSRRRGLRHELDVPSRLLLQRKRLRPRGLAVLNRPQRRACYWMCTPLIALAMMSRWISEVPSKMV
jgi:hypothetical protein